MNREALKPVAYLDERGKVVPVGKQRHSSSYLPDDRPIASIYTPLIPAPSPELVREIAEKVAAQYPERARTLAYDAAVSAINEALGHEGVKG